MARVISPVIIVNTANQYFNIIGYSNWYQGPKEGNKPRRNPGFAANLVNSHSDNSLDTPLENSFRSPMANAIVIGASSTLGKLDANLV